MMKNSIDLSAKLLANENISVRRANTQTASFDIVSRVLTIPLWKEMNPEIEQMLVGHEVGHALYTTEEYMAPIQENPVIKQYLNVLEDVRIEKLIKRKYPGIRKTMAEGYRQLNEKDFFGVSTTDVNELVLIDRINLYFKVGLSLNIKFTPEEKQFVVRAERTESIDDVVSLANEIYEFSKEEVKRKIEEAREQGDTTDDYEEVDPLDLDDMDDDMGYDYGPVEDGEEQQPEEDQEEVGKASSANYGSAEEYQERNIDDQLESKTEKIFQNKLAESADTSTRYNYLKLADDYVMDPMIPYKRILQETVEMESDSPEVLERRKKEYDSFMVETNKVVNYLVKEFEMRKSAQMYKRAQIAKVGSLDMRKVWAYKLQDDIFKRVTTIPQGKNHGMIFLLDWSGSMDFVIRDTIKQVIALAVFCQRVQIPFQVLAFTSEYRNKSNSYDEIYGEHLRLRKEYLKRYLETNTAETTMNNGISVFNLLELFSHKMSASEIVTMSRRLLDTYSFQSCNHHSFTLGGTPLNESLSYMYNYIPKFRQKYNVEKLSLITLTDGAGHSLNTVHGGKDPLRESGYEYDAEGKYHSFRQKAFLVDDVSKKTYAINNYGGSHTKAILRMIKDRYNVNTVGFYICENTRRTLSSAIQDNVPGYSGDFWTTIESMRKSFRDNGFYSLKGSGRDELFIIPKTKLVIQDDELTFRDGASSKSIARAFSKHLNSKKTSRMLLNNFVGLVA